MNNTNPNCACGDETQTSIYELCESCMDEYEAWHKEMDERNKFVVLGWEEAA
ncbi:MAG: hypothetical protein ACRD4O_12970 [Bryobacteraceae bacterium]